MRGGTLHYMFAELLRCIFFGGGSNRKPVKSPAKNNKQKTFAQKKKKKRMKKDVRSPWKRVCLISDTCYQLDGNIRIGQGTGWKSTPCTTVMFHPRAQRKLLMLDQRCAAAGPLPSSLLPSLLECSCSGHEADRYTRIHYTGWLCTMYQWIQIIPTVVSMIACFWDDEKSGICSFYKKNKKKQQQPLICI